MIPTSVLHTTALGRKVIATSPLYPERCRGNWPATRHPPTLRRSAPQGKPQKSQRRRRRWDIQPLTGEDSLQAYASTLWGGGVLKSAAAWCDSVHHKKGCSAFSTFLTFLTSLTSLTFLTSLCPISSLQNPLLLAILTSSAIRSVTPCSTMH